MRKTNLFKLIAILACMTLIFAGCSGSNNENAVDLNSYTLDEIIEKAKAEGHLESVGMPDSWANWGESRGETEKANRNRSDELCR